MSSRFRYAVMGRIDRRVVAAMPTGKGKGSSAPVGLENPLRRGRCPRLAIEIERRGVATEAREQCAAEAVPRYGRDRVVVRRVEGPFVANYSTALFLRGRGCAVSSPPDDEDEDGGYGEQMGSEQGL